MTSSIEYAPCDLAEAELEHRRRMRARMPLMDFIPAMSPRMVAPVWMAPIVHVFDRIKRGEVVRSLNSSPPQHGKTSVELHALVQLLLLDPRRRHAFISHTARFAQSRSRLCLQIARQAGVEIAPDSMARADWHTRQGGGLLAMGVDGGLTGEAITGVLIIDDPYRNRADAESSILRDRVRDFYDAVANARIHPTTSIVVTHTRWVPPDLIGELSRERQLDDPSQPVWERVNLPAVNEAGEALWEAGHPLRMLREVRERNEYDWWSLYMGEPRVRGLGVFRDVHTYEPDALPTTYRAGVGIDLAYTAKTHSDWCVAIVLHEHEGVYYVVDMRREQATPPDFAAQLRQIKLAEPTSRWLWYASSTEIGLADTLREMVGFPLVGELAKNDKFVRAQPAAAAWNAGKIKVPRTAPWLSDFLSEVGSFTGVADRNDDIVDALSAAFDVLDRTGGVARVKGVPSRLEPFGGNPFAPKGAVKW
jgi:predicted phage terminase large subunit-like protein